MPSLQTILTDEEGMVECHGFGMEPVPVTDEERLQMLLEGSADEQSSPSSFGPSASLPVRWFAAAALLCAAATCGIMAVARHGGPSDESNSASSVLRGDVTEAFTLTRSNSGEILGIIDQYALTGVSLGGWLCLEDWFFSMGKGKLVASSHQQGQGYALPPRIKFMSTPWTSEGLLTQRLINEHGQFRAINTISDYRASFLKAEDLREIAALGLRVVRLPITWAAFADALQPLDKATYGAHSADLDIVTVPDPFYKDQASFVTIPRQMLSDFLRQAKLSGLRVILDIHAYPGGASHGTYNGVWPLKCAFWTEKSKIGPEKNLTEVGMWIVEKMIHWIENLDFEPQGAIAGIVLMNEPGHMNRWKQFAADKAILAWLSEASARYSRSELPFLGIKLYMNLVETAFQDFEGVVVPWYHSTFSLEERKTRVVADVHYYMAWDYHVCDGRSDPFGAYSCTQNYQGTLRGCAEGNAKNMRRRWSQHDELVAVSEFSLGTFDQIDLACKELPVLETMLKEQLAAFAKYNFETIFWTWKMPYATDFQPGWSLKWLLSQHQERKK